jgi:peptide chain release factor 2
MYEEQAAQLNEFSQRLADLRKVLNVDTLKTQIDQLEAEMAASGFWDDPEGAQKVIQRLKGLKTTVAAPDNLRRELEDALVLVELAQAEGDESLGAEIGDLIQGIEERLGRLELNSLFTDPRDSKNAIVNIHPGAGGTESCDWADMLYRMITRWAERHEYVVEVLDLQPGEEAGIKSATLTIQGPFAYGNLKSESGVHRLVRISPYDAAKRRHTSFAAIEVLPEVDDDIDIEVKEEDLDIQFMRASGPGGQKVNKTSSAVRLTHRPSGIVVACQIERSQHRNRAMAIQLLKAKLYDIEMRKQEAERAAARDGMSEVAWGSQIRSYVLAPYQLVKDHRTEAETGNVDRVLDGEIDMFIEAYLKWKLQQRSVIES